MGRAWSSGVVSVAVLVVLWGEIQATRGDWVNEGMTRALLQDEGGDVFEVDELDEMGPPDVEAPAPEPIFVEKLCPEARVYNLKARFNWTAARHPVDYPDKASWSPLFGVIHNEEYKLFSFERNASEAVEQIAEEGKGTLLKQEVEDCIEEGNCREYLEFKCDEKAGDCKMTGNFTVNTTFSIVSLIVMAQPSPDWFTGVSSFDLCNDGAWRSEQTLRLNASDAGTDSGEKFTAKNRNIPVGKRGNVIEFDELSPENPFYNPDLIRKEFDEEGNEVVSEDAAPGGLEEVLLLKFEQNKETVDEDLGGGSGAVTVEEIDASELTEKEYQEQIEKEAAIRFIGPRSGCNPVAGHVLSVTILFLLATVVVLV